MSRNPYAHPMEPEPSLTDEARARVSGLAVSSLVFGILCCIPGSGLIAAILGGSGLIAISHSERRLSGRTMAFIGLVLGILGCAGWLAIGIGARREIAVIQTRLVDPSVATVQAPGNKDWAGARKLFAPSAGITDDQLKDFAARVEALFGPPLNSQSNITLEQILGDKPTAAVEAAGDNAVPLPVPIEFQNGKASVILVLKSQAAFGDVVFGGNIAEGGLGFE